ncbi:carboxylating nicotinate-nucleotide diphosphorylase [Chryseolinea sp. T2]|uniref:carboxylating nicotinate-nucleotide diphosphorylase n=1 Tax=Chryseolinea sp. T2 TaxID=3129255 RepID=UPI003076F6CC
MRPDYITTDYLDSFVRSAFAEDLGSGDHSSLAAVSQDAKSRARLLVKDHGILAGIELAQHVYKKFDPTLQVNILKCDSDEIAEGDIAFTVEGSSRSILATERLVLNCMQRMSGIATRAHTLVQLIQGTNAKLLDTRKTTPNFRLLEKWAVLIGGAFNHRIGLFDMIMLKDNHIDMAGGIRNAIIRTNDYLRAGNLKLRIEVETRNLAEVKEVLEVGGVDIIMLDNMSPADMREAVALVDGQYKTEASGNINETTIRAVAETGVDFISVGALTHSVRSLDLSLKAF